MGPTGRALVVALAMTEFFGASCMTLIVIWRTAVALLPDAGMRLPWQWPAQQPIRAMLSLSGIPSTDHSQDLTLNPQVF